MPRALPLVQEAPLYIHAASSPQEQQMHEEAMVHMAQIQMHDENMARAHRIDDLDETIRRAEAEKAHLVGAPDWRLELEREALLASGQPHNASFTPVDPKQAPVETAEVNDLMLTVHV